MAIRRVLGMVGVLVPAVVAGCQVSDADLIHAITGTGKPEACVPSCSGRECGPDPTCGESCGTCFGTGLCTIEGTCAYNGKVTFRAQIRDYLSKEAKIGVLVTVIDNDTGEATAVTATAAAEGMVEFELDKGRMYGFRSTLADHMDTYVWNIPSELPAGIDYEIIWILSDVGFGMAAALAGFTPDPAKATIAGGLYWVNDAGEEEYVECGTIKTVPGGEYRYLSGTTGLPAPLDQVPHTFGDKGGARYVAGNVPAGNVTMMGHNLDGTVKWAELTLWTKPDSVCISNLYVDRTQFTTNPTPTDCK